MRDGIVRPFHQDATPTRPRPPFDPFRSQITTRILPQTIYPDPPASDHPLQSTT